jgi:BirA family biotin operon repressor/biotin-[acetyl-CoA-carboxylase] ligase
VRWDQAALERALGIPVVIHGVVDSTMSRAEEDPRAPLVHLATEQRMGRGRLDRSWVSPPGNLYATVAWRERGEPLPAGLLGAIQIAWAETVAALGGPRVRCKWPNDGMLGEAKWAGMLARRGGDGRLLVGLGANLERAPDEGELERGAALAVALADHWEGWPGTSAVGQALLAAAVAVLREGATGIEARLGRWADHDAFEREISLQVETSQGEREGRYLGIAPDGRLRLAIEGREVTVAAGEARRVRAG